MEGADTRRRASAHLTSCICSSTARRNHILVVELSDRDPHECEVPPAMLWRGGLAGEVSARCLVGAKSPRSGQLKL